MESMTIGEIIAWSSLSSLVFSILANVIVYGIRYGFKNVWNMFFNNK